MIAELKKIMLQEQSNDYEKEKIQNAKTLSELGLSVLEAVSILESKGIPVILTEEDKSITPHEKNFFSKSALIAVHKTDYAPVNSEIKTNKNAKVMINESITINGNEYHYSFANERDTVHVALNGEVGSHEGGDWTSKKYIVLTPFEDIPSEQIGYAISVDTFTKGNLQLTQNSWILCPRGEAEQIRENNPTVHVIEYEGDNSLGYANAFISSLGYKTQKIGKMSWQNERGGADEEGEGQLEQIFEQEGIKRGPHAYTYFSENEDVLYCINKIVAIYDMLSKNDLVKSDKDISNIVEVLNENCSHELMRIFSPMADYSQGCPEAIKCDNKQISLFFEKMKEIGITVPKFHQSIFEQITNIRPMEYENSIMAIFENISQNPEFKNEELAKYANNVTDSTQQYRNNIVTKFMFACILQSRLRTRLEQETGYSIQKLRELGLTEDEISNLADFHEEGQDKKTEVEQVINNKKKEKEFELRVGCTIQSLRDYGFDENEIQELIIQTTPETGKEINVNLIMEHAKVKKRNDKFAFSCKIDLGYTVQELRELGFTEERIEDMMLTAYTERENIQRKISAKIREKDFEQEVGYTIQELKSLGLTQDEIGKLSRKFNGKTGERIDRKKVVEEELGKHRTPAKQTTEKGLTLQEIGQGTIQSFRTNPEKATEEFEKVEQHVSEKTKGEESREGEK